MAAYNWLFPLLIIVTLSVGQDLKLHGVSIDRNTFKGTAQVKITYGAGMFKLKKRSKSFTVKNQQEIKLKKQDKVYATLKLKEPYDIRTKAWQLKVEDPSHPLLSKFLKEIKGKTKMIHSRFGSVSASDVLKKWLRDDAENYIARNKWKVYGHIVANSKEKKAAAHITDDNYYDDDYYEYH